jgi:transcriptional regulator with XRE-family HTH domain
MDDQRAGTAVRSVRRRRGLSQSDLAGLSHVSQSTVSRIERGHMGSVSLDVLRTVCAVVDIRLDLVARWRGGDLDRLLNSRHSALHESVARSLTALPGWMLKPEVSFSIYGERGVIDLLAWHGGLRALCVIELKTAVADINELVGVVGRKRRLAARTVAEFGWMPASVSVWVIVEEGRTNRRRLQAHAAMLGAAFPADGRSIRGWLASPRGPIAVLSMWPRTHPGTRRLGSGAASRPAARTRVGS